jgi:hypothetical protein
VGTPTSREDWEKIWQNLKALEVPAVNAEKIVDLHAKILPFIPPEFRDNELYRTPTPEEVVAAKTKKRGRATKRTLTLVEKRGQGHANEEKGE